MLCYGIFSVLSVVSLLDTIHGVKILPSDYLVAVHDSQPRLSLCRNETIRVSKDDTISLCFVINSPTKNVPSKSFDCESIVFSPSQDGAHDRFVLKGGSNVCFGQMKKHAQGMGLYIPDDLEFTYFIETDPTGIASKRGTISVFLRWYEGEDAMLRLGVGATTTTKDFGEVSVPQLVLLTMAIVLTVF